MLCRTCGVFKTPQVYNQRIHTTTQSKRLNHKDTKTQRHKDNKDNSLLISFI
jgi:hypothetical protein